MLSAPPDLEDDVVKELDRGQLRCEAPLSMTTIVSRIKRGGYRPTMISPVRRGDIFP